MALLSPTFAHNNLPPSRIIKELRVVPLNCVSKVHLLTYVATYYIDLTKASLV